MYLHFMLQRRVETCKEQSISPNGRTEPNQPSCQTGEKCKTKTFLATHFLMYVNENQYQHIGW